MDHLTGLAEHLAFEYSTDEEIDRHGATFGAPAEQEWCLSSRDAWYRNPAYKGAPGRHPEDWHEGDDEPGEVNPDYCPEAFDDEIPF